MRAAGGRTLDTRGSLCPQPILDLAAEIASMEPAEELAIVSDDPAFELDLRAWCAGTGHELLTLDQDSRLFTARVRKRRD